MYGGSIPSEASNTFTSNENTAFAGHCCVYGNVGIWLCLWLTCFVNLPKVFFEASELLSLRGRMGRSPLLELELS